MLFRSTLRAVLLSDQMDCCWSINFAELDERASLHNMQHPYPMHVYCSSYYKTTKMGQMEKNMYLKTQNIVKNVTALEKEDGMRRLSFDCRDFLLYT